MITLDSLELPDELIWLDEFLWHSTVSSAKRTIGGSLVVFRSELIKGRPITLVGDDSWISRSALQILSDMVGHSSHTLTLHDSRVFSVEWRLWDQPVLDVEQVNPTAFQSSSTYWLFKSIKLVII